MWSAWECKNSNGAIELKTVFEITPLQKRLPLMSHLNAK
jgi:hypothetical protein